MEEYTIQEQLIRACGEGICNLVRDWRPAVAHNRCPHCGRKFYSLIEHESECRKLTDGERWQQFCDETGYRPEPQQMALPLEIER